MFAQRGARTHDPEIKSLMLYRLSQPGYQEQFQLIYICIGVAGVVVSCKIPILATRVRFPGDANIFFYIFVANTFCNQIQVGHI